jgi:hypothetical protein
MTSTASRDSGEQIRRPDDLEHWLTDIRENLSQDTQAWLEPVGDTDDPAGEPSPGPTVAEPSPDPAAAEPSPDPTVAEPQTSLDGGSPRPFVGRHRAED